MLRNSSFIIGCSVRATDGLVGSVVDLLHDDRAWNDRAWIVRWAVVDTGSWLSGRRVLLPPDRLAPADDEMGAFQVPLTRAQVEASPPEVSDPPVSRRYEQLLFGHDQWEPYWLGAGAFGIGTTPLMPAPEDVKPEDVVLPTGDDHLHSVEHLKGYRVEVPDGEIGHVEDLLVDPETWSIPLVEIAVGGWFSDRRIVLAPVQVEAIDWFRHTIRLRATRAKLEASPRFDPATAIDREGLRQLFSHYGLPTDWI